MSFLKSSYEAYKLVEALDRETQDREVSMARSNAAAILDKAIMLKDILTNDPSKSEGLKAWVQSKITTATNNVVMVHDYLKYYPGIEAKYTEVKEEVSKDEIDMVIASLNNIIHKSNEIGEMMVYMRDHNTELEPWVSSKIQTAKDNISAVCDYFHYSPDVAMESYELKEASLSDIHQMQKDGKSVEDIAKELKLNVGLVKKILGEAMTAADRLTAKQKQKMRNIKPEADNVSGGIEGIPTGGHTATGLGLGEETIKESDEVDFVKIDIPLFIRLLEFAREDANSDLDLHYLTTNLLKMKDKVASMSDYETIVKMPVKEDTAADKLNAKQKEKLKNQEIQNNKVAAGIEDVRKNTDTAEIGSIIKEAYNILKGGRKVVDTVNMEEKDDFKPHYMYEPKTGEKEWVTTYEKHLELDKKGWGHEAPKKEQVKEVKNCGCGQTPCITYGSQGKDPTIEEASSPAQQAAIAIAKKESGKYDKDGKRIKKEETELQETTPLQTANTMMKTLAAKAGIKPATSNAGYQAIYDYKNGEGSFKGQGKKSYEQVKNWIYKNGYDVQISFLKQIMGEEVKVTEEKLEKQPVKDIEEHIVKVKGGYQLQSKTTGKNLGTYPTKAGAEKRERQVQYFKHANESVQETKEPTGDLKDACWTGYTAIGFKMKNGKRVPNCVPKSEAYKGAKKVVENAWKKLKGKK